MWLQLYQAASTISTPLALAATAVLLFFLLLRFVLQKLEVPIKRISGTQAFVLIFTVLTYGTIISGVALVGGLGLFAYKNLYEALANKEDLIRQGDAALQNQEGAQAVRIGKKLVSGWGDEPDGYRIIGSGYFLQGRFEESASFFGEAANFGNQDVCESSKRNMLANSAAALGMAEDFLAALSEMDKIGGCELEKGMVLNYAKLLVLSKRPEDAIRQILDSRLLEDSRPDYRDRANFLLGSAYLLSNKPERTEASADAFVRAACLNSDFGRLFGAEITSSAVDPPGTLLQDFDAELLIIRQEGLNPFRVATYNRIKEEC